MRRDRIILKTIVLCVRLIGLIPRKWGDRLGCFLGRILFMADVKHRNIAMQNMGYAFDKPPHQFRSLSLRVFENLGRILFEFAWSLGLKENRFSKHFRIEGIHHIRDAYEKGKGVLMLTAHFGNWELLANLSPMLGYPISIVFRPLDFKPLDQFIINSRSRFGGHLIPKKKSMRHILKRLNQGDMVLLLMDQNVAWREGVFVDFFGHRACTNKGLALLALRTEVPVVPVFLIREPSGFVGKFLPEIPLIRTGDKTKDVEANTEYYNKVIESVVRQYPDQWFWVHQRWKTKAFKPWPKETKK